MNLNELAKKMDAFVDSKGWYAESSTKPQNPRNLSISISLEAAELLECFQWNETCDINHVREELADILLYSIQLANVLGIDLEKAILEKLEQNSQRTWH